MSAFMVDHAHIDAMLTAGLDARDGVRWLTDATEDQVPGERIPSGYRTLDFLNADHVGAMLLAENRRSVNYRYEEDELEEPYTFRPLRHSDITPVDILSAISCYEYQACECDDWQASEAARFCQALRLAMICKLPGYSDAPWEISRDYFTKRAAAKRDAARTRLEARRAAR